MSQSPHNPNHLIPCLVICFLSAFVLVGGTGCGESETSPGKAGFQSRHGHVHYPPHGGTPVILGNEDFHLEFVHIPQSGTLRCYVLDGHMNDFIRLTQPAIHMTLKRAGAESEQVLKLDAVATSATGETVGDTSQFEVQEDWLREYPIKFEALIQEVKVRGISYPEVKFTFPLTDY